MKQCKNFCPTVGICNLKTCEHKMGEAHIVGATILDLAKSFMFQLHYNTFKKNFHATF